MSTLGHPSIGPHLKRGQDGRLYQVGIADGQPVPLKKQRIMAGLTARRLQFTTEAEARLCSAFQSMCREIGTMRNGVLILRYRREKTVHIADIISRSLDFYFPDGHLAVEADGASHCGELERAKDQWLDELMEKHAGILVLRFTNENILNHTSQVISEIAYRLSQRHGWPKRIRQRFQAIIQRGKPAASNFQSVNQRRTT